MVAEQGTQWYGEHEGHEESEHDVIPSRASRWPKLTLANSVQ